MVDVTELEWTELDLGEIAFPRERLKISAGFGSGLTSRIKEGKREIWAISDRGPNLKIKDARRLYGWEPPAGWSDAEGAKLMPRTDVGPTLAQLEVTDAAVTVRQTIRLKDQNGRPISGLPVPETGHAECEPVLDLEGRHIQPDPSGMDTEGVAILADGSFWVSEEYGPSLVRLDAGGQVVFRLVPEGGATQGAGFKVWDTLPAIAAKRHLNRGFEALAATPSGTLLYVAFQSPLAHPGKKQHEEGRHVRLWQLDSSGTVAVQFLYPLDRPETFLRDNDKGSIDRSDIKVCEILALDEDRLLVLERASETSKIYAVTVDPAAALPVQHLDEDARPTLEQLSGSGDPVAELSKTLLFTSDDWPVVCADIEGMTMLDERSVLIVSDNDFGCEGKQTRFYRIRFDDPLSGSDQAVAEQG
jgi:hypothetical protein